MQKRGTRSKIEQSRNWTKSRASLFSLPHTHYITNFENTIIATARRRYRKLVYNIVVDNQEAGLIIACLRQNNYFNLTTAAFYDGSINRKTNR